MNEIQPQSFGILLAAGMIFIGCGLLYGISSIQDKDRRVFYFLHLKLVGQVPFFRVFWRMGKTSFAIVILGLLYFSTWASGLWATVIYAVIAGAERALKLAVKRPRPFAVLPDVNMSQPEKPQDPSHPSGDAMRIWYLAFVVPMAFGLPGSFLFVFCCMAFLVSLGRIALGVHFPLDVLGGTGLGLLGAALYQWCL